MSQEKDKIIFKNFSLKLTFIAVMMIAFYGIADLVTSKKDHTELDIKEKVNDVNLSLIHISEQTRQEAM